MFDPFVSWTEAGPNATTCPVPAPEREMYPSRPVGKPVPGAPIGTRARWTRMLGTRAPAIEVTWFGDAAVYALDALTREAHEDPSGYAARVLDVVQGRSEVLPGVAAWELA